MILNASSESGLDFKLDGVSKDMKQGRKISSRPFQEFVYSMT